MSETTGERHALPRTQRELLEAMQAGVRVIYQPYMGWFNHQEYYFRADTLKRVTAAANALLKKKLVRRAKDVLVISGSSNG